MSLFPHLALAENGTSLNGFTVGWGTLSLINAGIAQGKGRSGFNWFLVSLLLGPVATFFLVIDDSNTQEEIKTLKEQVKKLQDKTGIK
ncbi:MAG: hypothetical protein HY399_05010 [Elusimicrobia bacterium]|nr:hypothetical protein [Elusimicrobiota bacterium]